MELTLDSMLDALLPFFQAKILKICHAENGNCVTNVQSWDWARIKIELKIIIMCNVNFHFWSVAGSFESDALLVPPKCRFEHMHYDSQCKSHDEWRKQASDKCKSENMTLGDYGVLIPCEIGLFTGVEFVCCPEDGGEIATEAVKVVDVSVVSSTSKPVSVLEHLKSEISKFAKHVEASLIGM